jgi:hypothetical protein
MRHDLAIILMLVGLGLGSRPQAQASEPTPKLYSDEEIRKLSKLDIAPAEDGVAPFGVLSLDVVPAGEGEQRGKVFKTLKIDETRIRDFRHFQTDYVVFLRWQVSASYDICCMTATNDRENDGLALTDRRRQVYGIRLLKRVGK